MEMMGTDKPIKVFLDSSVLRVLTLGNEKLSYLLVWPILGCPIQVVLSSYTLSETLAALAEKNVPPKARIAVVKGLSMGLSQSGWHVHLPEPDPAQVQAMARYCRDQNDWPVLADALAEECSFLVTTDKDLLDLGAEEPIRCMRPETLQVLLENDPAIQRILQSIVDSFGPSSPIP